ncbi:MAG: peptidase C1A papain [Bacteroidetes bacterium]|nr:MAG: peptidase C1A papain [Bacteroidota bacterium]
MKKLLLFLCPFFLATAGIFAQPAVTRATGLDFDDDEYNNLPIQSKFAGSKFGELPLKASLRKYCPKPGDQGKIGSCVGWSTCYGALTTQYAIRNGWTDKKKITENAFSALFLYNLVRAEYPSCDGGTRIPIAMSKLQLTGTCKDKEFIRNNCSVVPADSLQKKAKNFAIQDYTGLFTTLDEERVKLTKTKQSIADKKPVVVGMTMLDNFSLISKTDPVWHTDKGLGLPTGGHAMVVVGYDEGKEQFELLNSWGEDWADSGYCYIKYADYAKYCRYGFQMLLRPESAAAQKSEVGGDFTFQFLNDKANLKFSPASPVMGLPGNYTLEKKDWKVGDLFQLVARNSEADEYVYVFSVDAKKEVHLHFPRSVESQTESFNETPLIPTKNVDVIIPSPESALSIGQTGTDYLVVLFSKTKIDNIKQVMAAAKAAPPGLIYFEMRKALGTRLVKSTDVKYQTDKMNFTFNGPADAIVPIILAVESK